MSPRSVKSYVYNVQKFHNYLEERGLNLLDSDKDILRDYLEFMRYDRGLHQKTVENNFTTLSSFYEYLAYEGLREENPVLQVRKRYLRRYKDNDDANPSAHLCGGDDPPHQFNPRCKNRRSSPSSRNGIRRKELIARGRRRHRLGGAEHQLNPQRKGPTGRYFSTTRHLSFCGGGLRVRESEIRTLKGPLHKQPWREDKAAKRSNRMVEKVAKQVGLHDPNSDGWRTISRPHCCRHCVHNPPRTADASRIHP
jgi:integrase/recombinase XerD